MHCDIIIFISTWQSMNEKHYNISSSWQLNYVARLKFSIKIFLLLISLESLQKKNEIKIRYIFIHKKRDLFEKKFESVYKNHDLLPQIDDYTFVKVKKSERRKKKKISSCNFAKRCTDNLIVVYLILLLNVCQIFISSLNNQ